MSLQITSNNIFEQPLFPIELIRDSNKSGNYNKLNEMLKSLKKAYLTVWHPDRNPVIPDYIEDIMSMFEEASDEQLISYECQKAVYNYEKNHSDSKVIENSPDWSIFNQLLANQKDIVKVLDSKSSVHVFCANPDMYVAMQIKHDNRVDLLYSTALSAFTDTEKTPIGVEYKLFDGKYWSELNFFEDGSKPKEIPLNLSLFSEDLSIAGWISQDLKSSNYSRKDGFGQLIASKLNSPKQMFIEPEYAWFIKNMQTESLDNSNLQGKRLVLFDSKNQKVALMPKIDVIGS